MRHPHSGAVAKAARLAPSHNTRHLTNGRPLGSRFLPARPPRSGINDAPACRLAAAGAEVDGGVLPGVCVNLLLRRCERNVRPAGGRPSPKPEHLMHHAVQ